MAVWVLDGNQKVNLDMASVISLQPNGDVHASFSGQGGHTFKGTAAKLVWSRVKAITVKPEPPKAAVRLSDVQKRQRVRPLEG